MHPLSHLRHSDKVAWALRAVAHAAAMRQGRFEDLRRPASSWAQADDTEVTICCCPRRCILITIDKPPASWLQVDDTEVINFLLSTEIIPLCLRTMEMGSELSKTVATFIVQKILLDNVGLNYICATAERFFAVGAVLGNMVGLESTECWSQCRMLDQLASGLAAHRCRTPEMHWTSAASAQGYGAS
jgi:Cell differentiation family, Rcd1-like